MLFITRRDICVLKATTTPLIKEKRAKRQIKRNTHSSLTQHLSHCDGTALHCGRRLGLHSWDGDCMQTFELYLTLKFTSFSHISFP